MTTNSGGFQFSLVGLLLAMAVVAGAMAVLFVFPDALATPIIIFLFIAVPALLTTHVVYGSGYERTFCIGALFPTGLALLIITLPLGLIAIDGLRRNLARFAHRCRDLRTTRVNSTCQKTQCLWGVCIQTPIFQA